MNKYLASYIFAGETIFNIDALGATSKVAVAPEVQNPTQSTSTKPIEQAVQPKPVVIEKPQKGLLIAVNDISEVQKEFLSKILLSVKKDITQADILDLSKPNAINPLDYKEIISFGIAANKLKFDQQVANYQPKMINHTNFILVDTLEVIQLNHKDEKRTLWTALKTMFGI